MHMIGFWALLSLLMLSGCEHEFALSEQVGKEEVFSEKVQLEIFARANSYHPYAIFGRRPKMAYGW